MLSNRLTKGILVGTLLRLGLLILQRSTSLSKYVESPALQSALFNPLYTLSHLREGHFLTQLTKEGTVMAPNEPGRNFGFTFQPSRVSFFHSVSPLLLALVDPLLSKVQSEYRQDLILTMAMILIDALVALQLYYLAQNVMGMTYKANERELLLEKYMNPVIEPPNAWIFGMEFGTAFVPEEKEIETNESESSNNGKEPFITVSQIPELCSLLYFLNPITVCAAATTKSSLQGLFYLLLLSAFEEISQEKPNLSKATLYLAILANIELYTIVYLIPLILLLERVRRDKTLKQCITGTSASFYVSSLSRFNHSDLPHFLSSLYYILLHMDSCTTNVRTVSGWK